MLHRLQRSGFVLGLAVLLSGCATATSGSDDPPATQATEERVLTAEETGNLLEDEWKIVTRCYEFELESQPDLSGDIQVSFQVDEDGTTTDVELLTSNLPVERAKTCILREISLSELPSLAASPTVVATLAFRPESVPAREHSLSRSDITSTIQRYQKAFQQCGEGRPDLSGDSHYLIYIDFQIESSGAVSKISTHNANADEPDLERCVHQVFEEMRFPSFPGGSALPVVFPIQVGDSTDI